MSFLGDLAGSLVGSVFGFAQANKQDAMNVAMLERSQAFNREVMQNRHQWEVEDLRNAGLNPLMSVTSPTGTLSSPSGQAGQIPNVVESAVALKNAQSNNKVADAQLLNARAALKNANTAEDAQNLEQNKFSFESGKKFQYEWYKYDRSQSNIERQTAAQISNALAQADVYAKESELKQIAIKWEPILKASQNNEILQRIANSVIITGAQAAYLEKSGDAALMSAAAQQSQAASAWAVANTLEKNGVSQREFQSAMQHSTEIKNEVDEMEKEIKELEYNSPTYRASRVIGDTFDALLGNGGVSTFGSGLTDFAASVMKMLPK